VPVPDLLDGVGREDARRVDRAIVDGFPLQSCHEVMFLPIVTASGTDRPRPAEDVAARFRPGDGFDRQSGETPLGRTREAGRAFLSIWISGPV
jgi:hypothetical protein